MDNAPYSSPAMNALIEQYEAQARLTSVRERKLGARRFLNTPQNLSEVEERGIPLAVDTVNRWFGFGGELQLLRMRSVQLYIRYRRYITYIRTKKDVA